MSSDCLMSRSDRKQTFCCWRIIQRALMDEVEYNKVQYGLNFTVSLISAMDAVYVGVT
jgi:hypothetical protein